MDFGLPLSTITMLGSAVIGGVMKMVASKMQAAQFHQQLLISKANAQDKLTQGARAEADKSWFTKGVVALLAVMGIGGIVVFPMVAAFLHPDMKITVAWIEFHPGLLFFPDKSVMQWHTVTGLTITPMHENLVAAITGFYFGSRIHE